MFGCGLSWVGWCVGGELCGPSLHSQGNSGEDRAFALCARGCGVRFLCSFRLDPLTLGGSWVGDQGPMAGGGVALGVGWITGFVGKNNCR